MNMRQTRSAVHGMRFTNERGASLISVLIAMVILSFISAAALSMFIRVAHTQLSATQMIVAATSANFAAHDTKLPSGYTATPIIATTTITPATGAAVSESTGITGVQASNGGLSWFSLTPTTTAGAAAS